MGQSVGMGQRQRRPQQQQQRRYNRDAEPVFVQRSALLSKPVITRTSGTNLGVVNQLWVDTSQWKVVALYEPPWEAAYRDQYEMDYYALPPYQEQYNTNRMMPPPPPQQQYQNYNSNYNTQQQPVQAREMNTMNTRAEPTGSTYNSYQGGGGYSRQMPQPRPSSQPQPQPQKRYDDFIEVQEDPPEPEPVYEAQIQQNMQREQSSSSSSSSSSSGQTPRSASGRGGYNKD